MKISAGKLFACSIYSKTTRKAHLKFFQQPYILTNEANTRREVQEAGKAGWWTLCEYNFRTFEMRFKETLRGTSLGLIKNILLEQQQQTQIWQLSKRKKLSKAVVQWDKQLFDFFFSTLWPTSLTIWVQKKVTLKGIEKNWDLLFKGGWWHLWPCLDWDWGFQGHFPTFFPLSSITQTCSGELWE